MEDTREVLDAHLESHVRAQSSLWDYAWRAVFLAALIGVVTWKILHDAGPQRIHQMQEMIEQCWQQSMLATTEQKRTVLSNCQRLETEYKQHYGG